MRLPIRPSSIGLTNERMCAMRIQYTIHIHTEPVVSARIQVRPIGDHAEERFARYVTVGISQ